MSHIPSRWEATSQKPGGSPAKTQEGPQPGLKFKFLIVHGKLESELDAVKIAPVPAQEEGHPRG